MGQQQSQSSETPAEDLLSIALKAVEKGNFTLLKKIVNRKSHFDHVGMTKVLYHAVSFQQLEIVQYLLREFEVFESPNKTLPLTAVFDHQPRNMEKLEEIVKILLAHKADINARGHVDRTVLLKSVVHGFSSITKILLDHGADPNIQDRDGLLPVHVCATYSSLPLLKQVLASGANIDGRDSKGRTALYFATLAGHFDIFEELVRHGCNINLGSRHGFPLQTAIIKRRVRMVQALLKEGVDVQCRIEEQRQSFSRARDYLNLALLVAHSVLTCHSQDHNYAETLRKSLQILYLMTEAVGKPESFAKNIYVKSQRHPGDDTDSASPALKHIAHKLAFIHNMSNTNMSKQADGLLKMKNSTNRPSLQNICRMRVRELIAATGTNVLYVVEKLDCSVVLKDIILLRDVVCTCISETD